MSQAFARLPGIRDLKRREKSEDAPLGAPDGERPARGRVTTVEFRKSKPVSLKAHEVYNEKWLQRLLAADPSLLGLGDLVVKDVERRQPRAGRLDLLLSDPETLSRYEVEIQLGATDEAHIIRTIEYWDIEKSRYPQYEHVALIVAEDITSRFLKRDQSVQQDDSADRHSDACS